MFFAIAVGIVVLAALFTATYTTALTMPSVPGVSMPSVNLPGMSAVPTGGSGVSVGQQLNVAGNLNVPEIGLPGQSGGSLARQINCFVFGILGMGTGDCGTQPPPPPPPPPGGHDGRLTVFKIVQGGSAQPWSFTIHVQQNASSTTDAFPGSSSGTSVDVDAGASYSVWEDMNNNTGYTSSFSSGCSGTMPANGFRTCVVTNTFTGTTTPNGSIRIVKNVVGGTASSSAFMLHLHREVGQSMVDVVGSPQPGNAAGTTYLNLSPGAYHVEETGGPAGYAQTFSGACSGSGAVNLATSTAVTCVVTNTFQATSTTGMLHVAKVVNGGTATSSNFMVHVMSGSSEVAGSPQAGSGAGTSYMLPFGTYAVSETGGPSGYTQSFSGDCNSSGSVTLSSTSTKHCMITNTFATSTVPGTGGVTLFKVVNGGTASSSAFMLHLKNVASSTEVSGSPQMGSSMGTVYLNLAPGTYQVWETGSATTSYTQSFSGDCTQSGTFTLTASSSKTCTLTNTFTASSTDQQLSDLVRLLRDVLDRMR